jgi:calcineurin-like phosphoesterase family protein
MGKIWLFTDPHFGHDKLVSEGFRPQGYDDLILGNLKRCVRPGDLLICLGDVCWNNDAYWHDLLAKIPATKWLCLGNHDKKSLSWYLSNGWSWVGRSCSIELYGKCILFSHCPVKDTGDWDLKYPWSLPCFWIGESSGQGTRVVCSGHGQAQTYFNGGSAFMSL